MDRPVAGEAPGHITRLRRGGVRARGRVALGVLALTTLALACGYPDGSRRAPIKKSGSSGAPDPDVDRERVDEELVEDPADPVPPPDAAAGCSLAAPFGAPTLVAGLDPDAHASSPRVSPDELAVYFTGHDPEAGSQIMRATRGSRDQPFGRAEEVPGVNSELNDNDPSVSSDGLTLVFHTGRGGDNDVWWAKRANTGVEFGAPTAVPGIATEAYEGQGFFHVASGELYFVSNRGGDYDLFRAKLEGDGFGDVAPVSELNTSDGEFLPFLSADGLTILFSSTREGTKGGQDLYLATRASPTSVFGAPTPIDELNTSAAEQAGSLSSDGCRIYFSREGGPGGQQLFTAERALAP